MNPFLEQKSGFWIDHLESWKNNFIFAITIFKVSSINLLNKNTAKTLTISTKQKKLGQYNREEEKKDEEDSDVKYEKDTYRGNGKNYLIKTKPKLQNTTPENEITFEDYVYGEDEEEEEDDEDDDDADYTYTNKELKVPLVQQPRQYDKWNIPDSERSDQSNDAEEEDVTSSEDEDDSVMKNHRYSHHHHHHHRMNPSTAVSSQQQDQHSNQPRQLRREHGNFPNTKQNGYRLHDRHNRYNKNIVKVDFTNLNTVSSSEHIIRGIPSSSSSSFLSRSSSPLPVLVLSLFFSFIFSLSFSQTISIVSTFSTRWLRVIALYTVASLSTLLFSPLSSFLPPSITPWASFDIKNYTFLYYYMKSLFLFLISFIYFSLLQIQKTK